MNDKILFTWRTTEGEPVTVGKRTITPVSQALVLRWPGGGGVWNRPAAVLVEENGRRQRHVILDFTRLVQVAALGLSALFAMLALLTPNRKEKTDDKGI